MKNNITSLLIILLFLGCSNDENGGIDCELFDPAFPTLFLAVVDAENTNLFENCTFNPEDIRVEGDFTNAGFLFNPASEFAVPEADIRKLDNTIQLIIPRESNFRYTIFLSTTESIEVDFSAEFTRIPCDLSYYLPSGGVFDGLEIELSEVPPLQFVGIVELS